MSTNLRYTLTLHDLFSKRMDIAHAKTVQMDSKMSRLGRTMRTAFVGLGVGLLARELVTVGASFERAEIGLRTLLKSSVKAKMVFEDLQESAEISPFSFETLLTGNRLLISAGVSAKRAKTDFDNLANAIAATGGTEDTLQRMALNLQQIKNIGKATALDIKQFGFAGVPIYRLLNEEAAKYGETVDMQNVTYDKITRALKGAAAEGGVYFNALNNLANSTSGRLSNLGDAFKNTLYVVFQSLSPLINKTVLMLTGLLDGIKNNIGAISSFGKAVAIAVTALVAFKVITGTIAAFQAVKFTIALASMASGIAGTTIAQVLLNTAMLANPLGIVIAAIAAAVIAWNLYSDSVERARALHQKDIQKAAIAKGIKEETERVTNLAAAYRNSGLSAEAAAKKALIFEIASTQGLIKSLEGGVGNEKKLEIAYAQLNSLEKHAKPLGIKVGGGIDEAATDAKKTKTGSGTEGHGARPQNLHIQIGKLIETQVNKFNGNVRESKEQIKESMTKILLEAVNDINTLAN